MALDISNLNLPEFLSYVYFGNQVIDYLLAAVIFIVAIMVMKIFKHVIVDKLKKLTEKTHSDIDDLIIKIIDNIGWPLYLLLAFYISVKFLQLPDIVHTVIHYVTLLVIIYYAVRSVQSVIDYTTRRVVVMKQKGEEKADTTVINVFNKILKALVWLFAIVIIIQSFGYDVSNVVVGLGVGGIVIGFALQNVLNDVFASFSIYFDKPFEVGDFIILSGDDLGTVKKIGIRSTRIQHLKGHELVVSNRELTSIRINNYKKMKKRRISFTFGVVYGTPTKKMEKIPGIVKEVIKKIELADIDRVHFKEFGNFSLNFEVVYYVATSDYNKYMDIQQKINLRIKEKFEKERIEMAFPTQTVYVNKLK